MTEKYRYQIGMQNSAERRYTERKQAKIIKIVHNKTIPKGVFSAKYAFLRRCSKRNVKFLQKVLSFCEICAII